MRRVISLLLSAALLLGALCACQRMGEDLGAASSDQAAAELMELAFQHSGRTDRDGLEELRAESAREELAVYIENAYGIQDPWEDAAVLRATGASAFEIAVVRMEDEGAAVLAASRFMSYMSSRQGDFVGYAPAEADMAANGGLLQKEPFAALFICPDPDGACDAVEAALSGEDPSGQSDSGDAVKDVKALRDILVSSQGMDGAELEKLDDNDSEALNAYVQDAYGLTPDQWEECAIARGTGDSAFEVAIFCVQSAVGDVEQKLNVYLNDREAAFSDSDQSDMLYQALTIISERYVVLLACEDAESAGMDFIEAAGTGGYGCSPRHRFPAVAPGYPDRCKFTPPNQDDMSLYDTSAILAAWESEDPSGLSKEDKKIYEQAQKVLKKLLKDGMSDYEKEVAVYDWVVNSVNYDWTHQDRRKTTPRESFTPYGGLVNRKAVCLGYATTFQLLMDMAGVECITVPGAAFSSMEDHGWNMVRLNGEWYCVDVTWDANQREQVGLKGLKNWDYFNVTSDHMAETDHQWDYANTPEATAKDRGRG